MLKVTWIAPVLPGYPPLGWLKELAGMSQIPDVVLETLTGDSITIAQVSSIMKRPANIIIWAGHGSRKGLLLPAAAGGVMFVRPRFLAAAAAATPELNLVILAACGSQGSDEDTLMSLTAELSTVGITSIGFPVSADDAAAATFATSFVNIAAMGSPLRRSLKVALDDISDTPLASGIQLTPGMASDLPLTQARAAPLDEIRRSLRRIEEMLGINEAGAQRQDTSPRLVSRSSTVPIAGVPGSRIE